MSLEISEALIAHQSPEAQRILLAHIAGLKAKVVELEARLNQTP